MERPIDRARPSPPCLVVWKVNRFCVDVLSDEISFDAVSRQKGERCRQKIRSTGRQNNAAKSPDRRKKRCLIQEFQEFLPAYGARGDLSATGLGFISFDS